MGLKRCLLPESCLEGLTIPDGVKAIGVRSLRQAVNAVITKDRTRDQASGYDREPEPSFNSG